MKNIILAHLITLTFSFNAVAQEPYQPSQCLQTELVNEQPACVKVIDDSVAAQNNVVVSEGVVTMPKWQGSVVHIHVGNGPGNGSDQSFLHKGYKSEPAGVSGDPTTGQFVKTFTSGKDVEVILPAALPNLVHLQANTRPLLDSEVLEVLDNKEMPLKGGTLDANLLAGMDGYFEQFAVGNIPDFKEQDDEQYEVENADGSKVKVPADKEALLILAMADRAQFPANNPEKLSATLDGGGYDIGKWPLKKGGTTVWKWHPPGADFCEKIKFGWTGSRKAYGWRPLFPCYSGTEERKSPLYLDFNYSDSITYELPADPKANVGIAVYRSHFGDGGPEYLMSFEIAREHFKNSYLLLTHFGTLSTPYLVVGLRPK